MSTEVLIRVEQVRKKFCRSLRQSLKYGLQDIAADLIGQNQANTKLRPGEFYAVDDVSFALQRGECLGLIGKNGAGKTTLLKMLNGLIKPDAGKITVRGRVGALIALGAGFNPLLTGRENIFVNGAILGMSKGTINSKIERIIEFAELREFIDAPVQSYSSGMVVRLGFAVAVHCEPESLLLDEVLAVGDGAFQAKCYNTLSDFRKRGVGFILVSHNLSSIDCFCDSVVYLKRGRSVFVGNTHSGIAEYNRDMLNETMPPQSIDGEMDRSRGTGKVVMTRILFLDGESNQITEMRAGDPLTLRIEFRCMGPETIGAVVDVYIRDQAGVFFHDPHAFKCELRDTGHVDFRFDSIPANNQRLFFSLCLTDRDSWEIFDWKSDFALTVHGSPCSQGRVHLSFECELVQEEKRVACAGK